MSEDAFHEAHRGARRGPRARLQQVPEAQHGRDRDYDVPRTGAPSWCSPAGRPRPSARCRFVPPTATAVGLGPRGAAGPRHGRLRGLAARTCAAAAPWRRTGARRAAPSGSAPPTGTRCCRSAGAGRLRLDSGALALREEAGTLVEALEADAGPSAAVSVAVTEALPGLNVGSFAILGEGEAVRVTASTLIDGLYALTVLRAQLGTDAARHDAGALLRVVASAASPPESTSWVPPFAGTS